MNSSIVEIRTGSGVSIRRGSLGCDPFAVGNGAGCSPRMAMELGSFYKEVDYRLYCEERSNHRQLCEKLAVRADRDGRHGDAARIRARFRRWDIHHFKVFLGAGLDPAGVEDLMKEVFHA